MPSIIIEPCRPRSSIRKQILSSLLLFLSGCAAVSESGSVALSILPPLPQPLSNNAVVTVRSGDREYVVSFAGLGEGRRAADTLAVTYVFDGRIKQWGKKDALPGGTGRLAAAAASVGELAYVFGGYSVAEDGSEISTAFVHSFDPVTGVFRELQSMPVPVDDAVAVAYGDRYIYLISGWHDLGNVNLVQQYDTQTDRWVQATPTPGRGVFGHAGGIIGNTILYCDGVAIAAHTDRRREFIANGECFTGVIDAADPRRIDWRTVPPHPGVPRYRMAASGVDRLNSFLFIGGSDNPYNFDGIGYNGELSKPVAGGLRFDLATRSWHSFSTEGPGTMDHRGLAGFGNAWLTVGGMLAGQRVTDRVFAYRFD